MMPARSLAGDDLSHQITELTQTQTQQPVYIRKSLARKLYLEDVTVKTRGIDFLNGCKELQMNKHALLTGSKFPVIQYLGLTIVGSPYQSVPVKTGTNNNPTYFKRITAALNILQDTAPQTLSTIAAVMQRNRGYIIIDNICPTDGGLAFAAFVPRTNPKGYVVIVSSTLLLVPELFNDYDIAAQLVHEIHGHAVEYERRGTTDEAHAFAIQAAFARTVGDDRFLDVNNRTVNINTKIKLKLSRGGTYVKSKPLGVKSKPGVPQP